MLSEKGQSLMELVVVVAVAVVVISALVFATIASLRNASFAQNQLQATKLAQQGLERIRTLRDRDGDVIFEGQTKKFSELSGIRCPEDCDFVFNKSGVLISGSIPEKPPDSPDFSRQFQIIDEGSDQKKVTAVVKWTDFSGSHESRLTTILRNTK